MRRARECVLIAVTLLLPGLLFTGSAMAQSARELAGVWILLSSDTVNPDGRRTPTLGPHPTGKLMFTDDGHFIWLLINPDLPKFASNNRATGTSEENAVVVRGSIAVYGTYVVNAKDLLFNIEGSTFPNWSGTQQKRTITSFDGDGLKWTNPAGSTGGIAELMFRRAGLSP
jgi:Lipocalin-like domain